MSLRPICNAAIWIGRRYCSTCDSYLPYPEGEDHFCQTMALNPEILLFNEPSAGLDPLSVRRLDDLILELNNNLDTTMVVVTHELASIFAIGSNSVFLDGSKRTMTATGNPNQLLAETQDPTLHLFLTRGEKS